MNQILSLFIFLIASEVEVLRIEWFSIPCKRGTNIIVGMVRSLTNSLRVLLQTFHRGNRRQTSQCFGTSDSPPVYCTFGSRRASVSNIQNPVPSADPIPMYRQNIQPCLETVRRKVCRVSRRLLDIPNTLFHGTFVSTASVRLQMKKKPFILSDLHTPTTAFSEDTNYADKI